MSDDDRERRFVEEMGLRFEELGAQRMVGRVLGRLLVCQPPHQTNAELADYLETSTGSISTATRTLVQMGMIRKVGVAGERATYFQLDADVWVDLMRGRLAVLTTMRQTAERGLEALEGAPSEATERLRTFRDFYRFMEAQMPGIVDAWVAGQEETT